MSDEKKFNQPWDVLCENLNEEYRKVLIEEISIFEFRAFLAKTANSMLILNPKKFDKYETDKIARKLELENNSSVSIMIAIKVFIRTYVENKNKIKNNAAATFVFILSQKTNMVIRRERENARFGQIFSDDSDENDSEARETWRKCLDAYNYVKNHSKNASLSEQEILEKTAGLVGKSVSLVKKYIDIKPLQSIFVKTQDGNEIYVTDLDIKDEGTSELNENIERTEAINSLDKIFQIAEKIWEEKEERNSYISEIFTVHMLSNLPEYVESNFLIKYNIINKEYLKLYLNNSALPSFADIDKKYEKKDSATNTKKRFLAKIKSQFTE